MQATTHAELVDEIVNAIMVRLRDIFPIRQPLDVEAIAADCGVPLKIERVRGAPEISGDEVFGTSFIDLAKATAYWLHAEGYLIAAGGSEHPYYTLSERGARLCQCLPPTVDKD